jgi:hypothetical protein
MKREGATEQEKAKAVDLVRSGKSLDYVKSYFPHVEADYFDRNEEDLLILAGKKKAPKGHWTEKPAEPQKPAEKPAEKPADPLA